MGNFKTEHKTSKTLRDRVKQYQNNMKENEPEKYKQRLEYLRNYYKERQEAIKKLRIFEMMNQNTHEILA